MCFFFGRIEKEKSKESVLYNEEIDLRQCLEEE